MSMMLQVTVLQQTQNIHAGNGRPPFFDGSRIFFVFIFLLKVSVQRS
jgi:hypothetical protein